MGVYVVKTWEHVAGRYEVEADSAEEARARFEQLPEPQIDWRGVKQADYMAFALEVRDVTIEGDEDE